MRIELPSGYWDTTALRVDDDAHTLTLAPQAEERLVAWYSADAAPTLRAEVPATEPVTLTLTL